MKKMKSKKRIIATVLTLVMAFVIAVPQLAMAAEPTGPAIANVTVQLGTRVNGDVEFAGYTVPDGTGYLWDYNEDVYYHTILEITPYTDGASGSIIVTAPEGMHFIKPTSLEKEISSITINGRDATIVLSNDAQASNNFSVDMMTCVLAKTGTSTDPTEVEKHRDLVGLMIGTDIKNAYGESSTRPTYTTIVKDSNNNELREVISFTKEYTMEDIFTGFYYSAPFSPRVNPITINKYGQIGFSDYGGFLTENYAGLDNQTLHDPYWNLTFKIEIPSDMTIGELGPRDKMIEEDGKTYVYFPDITSYADLTGGGNPDRMLIPSIDVFGNSSWDNGNVTNYKSGINVFSTRLDLKLKPGVLPTSTKSYNLPVTVTYTNWEGDQTQELNYGLLTDTFNFVDKYSIHDSVQVSYAGSFNPSIDLPQGFNGDTSSYSEYITIASTAGTDENDPHANGKLVLTPGLGYEIYSVTLPKAVSAEYTIGETTYSGDDVIKEGDTFTFTKATEGNRIEKIVLNFGTNGINLQDTQSIKLYLGLRALDKVNGEDMGNVYKSSLRVSLQGADDHINNSAGNPVNHEKLFDVFFRKPVDDLILQTYGRSHETAGVALPAPNFISGQGTVADGFSASIAFGYESALANGGKEANKGQWQVYKNVVLSVISGRALETFSGNIEIGKYLSYRGAKFIFSTQDRTDVVVEVPDSGVFTPIPGTAKAIDLGLRLKTSDVPGEYLTSLRFEADEFMVTHVSYLFGAGASGDTGAYWSNLGNGTGDGGRINFKSRTDREFSSDGELIPNYVKGDSDTSFDLNATFVADGVEERNATPFSNIPVRFAHYTNVRIYDTGANETCIANGGNTINSGTTFNVRFTVQHRSSPIIYLPTLKNRSAIIRLNSDYIYVGTDPRVSQVQALDGSNWLVVKDLDAASDYTNIYSTKYAMSFDLTVMALPTAKSGQGQVVAEGYYDYTDTFDFNYASTTYPYGVPTEFYSGKGVRDDSIDRDGDGVTNEVFRPMVLSKNNIVSTYADNVQIIPGVDGLLNINGVNFYNDKMNLLTSDIFVGTGTQPRENYEVKIHIPSQGDIVTYTSDANQKEATAEYDMRLTGPLDMSHESFAAITESYAVSYSIDGGGNYVDEATIAGDWSSVTDVRIFFEEIPAKTTVRPIMHLEALNNAQLAYDEDTLLAATYTFDGMVNSPSYSNGALYEYRLDKVNVHFFANYELDDVADEVADGEYLTYRINNVLYGSGIASPGNIPERPGYDFAAWAKDPADDAVLWDFDLDNVTNHTNLYAMWDPDYSDPYWLHVTYEKGVTDDAQVPSGNVPEDNGHYIENDEITVASHSDLIAPTGWEFDGWSDGTTVYAQGEKLSMPDSNVTLTAQWKLIDYTVRYLPGAHGTFAAFTHNALHYNQNTPAAPVTAVLLGDYGWEFQGFTPEASAKVTGDCDYVATWARSIFTVIYHGNGHNIGEVPQGSTLAYGSSYVVASAGSMARDGYTFAGWSSSENGAITHHVGESYAITGNVHLYALWNKVDEKPPVVVEEPETPDSPPVTESTVTPGDGQPAKASKVAGKEVSGESNIPILPGGVPLYGKTGTVWALLNLVLCIAGVILAVILLIAVAKRHKRRKDEAEDRVEEDDESVSDRKRWMIITAIFSLLGVLLFLFTEDMRLPMVLVDKWTIVNAIIIVFEIVATKLTLKKDKEEDDVEYSDLAAI